MEIDSWKFFQTIRFDTCKSTNDVIWHLISSINDTKKKGLILQLKAFSLNKDMALYMWEKEIELPSKLDKFMLLGYCPRKFLVSFRF